MELEAGVITNRAG
ncbi:hypothetical protein AVEN_94605-1, partial [Araneus ventricosus]